MDEFTTNSTQDGKECKSCHIVLPAGAFYPTHRQCKACRRAFYYSEEGREYRRLNIERTRARLATDEAKARDRERTRARYHSSPETKERIKKQAKDWQARNKERRRGQKKARRAVVKGNGGSFTADQWFVLCAKYDHKCLACGLHKPLTVDHVVPISKGGTSFIDNIQPLCLSCNSRKHNKATDYRSKEKPTPY